MFPSFFHVVPPNCTVARLKLLRRHKYLRKAYHISRVNTIISNLQKLFQLFTPQVLTRAK